MSINIFKFENFYLVQDIKKELLLNKGEYIEINSKVRGWKISYEDIEKFVKDISDKFKVNIINTLFMIISTIFNIKILIQDEWMIYQQYFSKYKYLKTNSLGSGWIIDYNKLEELIKYIESKGYKYKINRYININIFKMGDKIFIKDKYKFFENTKLFTNYSQKDHGWFFNLNEYSSLVKVLHNLGLITFLNSDQKIIVYDLPTHIFISDPNKLLLEHFQRYKYGKEKVIGDGWFIPSNKRNDLIKYFNDKGISYEFLRVEQVENKDSKDIIALFNSGGNVIKTLKQESEVCPLIGSRLKIISTLGRGAYGKVFKLKDEENGYEYALKTMLNSGTTNLPELKCEMNLDKYMCDNEVVPELLIGLINGELVSKGKCPFYVDVFQFATCHQPKLTYYTFMEIISTTLRSFIYGKKYKDKYGHENYDMNGEILKYSVKQTPLIIDSIVLQIIIAIANYQERFWISHNDLHLENIFLLKIPNGYKYNGRDISKVDYFEYTYKKRKIYIPNVGLLVKLGDWGMSCKFSVRQIYNNPVMKGLVDYSAQYMNGKVGYLYMPNYYFPEYDLAFSLRDLYSELKYVLGRNFNDLAGTFINILYVLTNSSNLEQYFGKYYASESGRPFSDDVLKEPLKGFKTANQFLSSNSLDRVIPQYLNIPANASYANIGNL